MYKVTGSKVVFEHPRITLVEDKIILFDGSVSEYLKFAYRHNSAQVLGQNDEGKFILINEYSHSVASQLMMFPGGLIALDEDIQEGARREFLEETGYSADKLTYLGYIYPYHRRNPEILHCFFSQQLKFSGTKLEFSEAGLETVSYTEAEIDGLISTNQITNSHALAHWQLYKNHQTGKKLAKGVAIIIKNSDGEILLMKRGNKNKPGFNKWKNCGGKVEPGEDIVDAVRREVNEELGCEVSINRALFTENSNPERPVSVFEGHLLSNPQIKEPEECLEIKWVNPDQLSSLDLVDYTKKDFQHLGLLA